MLIHTQYPSIVIERKSHVRIGFPDQIIEQFILIVHNCIRITYRLLDAALADLDACAREYGCIEDPSFYLQMAECARVRAQYCSSIKDYNNAQLAYDEQAAWLKIGAR